MEDLLKKIRDFAAEAHIGQKRKYTPEEYIVHPVRVMQLCAEYTDKLPVLAAALLHDVLEDTSVTKDQMKEFLAALMDKQQADYTVRLVEELTDVYVKENFPQWNRKKRKIKEAERVENTSADAQTVKYADMIDNCIEIVQYDRDFARVFLNECRNILKRMPKGDQKLHQRAVQTVDEAVRKLQGQNIKSV